MTASKTRRLAGEIERALPDRPFTIELWDGVQVAATRTPAPTIRFSSPRAIGHILRAPGQLGLGRAYVCGDIEVDDLDSITAMLGRWEAPSLGLRGRARLATAALQAAGMR